MADRNQERAAVGMFIEAVRLERAVELEILRDEPEEFPDFVLSSPAGDEIWGGGIRRTDRGGAPRAAPLRSGSAGILRAARGGRAGSIAARVQRVTPSPGYGVTGVLIPAPFRKASPADWIAKALVRKGDRRRYGSTERGRTMLVIDCSREVAIEKEDAADVRNDLKWETLGFKELWCVSANWTAPRALLLAP